MYDRITGQRIVDATGQPTAYLLGLDDRFKSQLETDVGSAQPANANLTAIAGLTTAADKLIYWTGAGLAALTTLTSFARSLLAAANQAAAQTVLGLTIGTNVQAYDADLDAVAGLSSSGLIARTGAGTAASRTLTGPAAGITVSNGNGVSGNPTLALANDLSAIEALTGSNVIPVRTGTDTWTTAVFKTGSVTPTFALATPGTSSFVHATQTGAYYQIGKLVFLDFNCTAAFTVGTGSGNLQITIALDGVTISIDNTGLSAGAVRYMSSTVTWPAGTTSVSVTPGGTTFLWVNAHGTGIDSTQIIGANLTSGTTIQIIGAITLIVT
jgi:hypothetical protein